MKYADAGVDIAVADAVKQRIRHHASRTFTKGVLGGIGVVGFSNNPSGTGVQGSSSNIGVTGNGGGVGGT